MANEADVPGGRPSALASRDDNSHAVPADPKNATIKPNAGSSGNSVVAMSRNNRAGIATHNANAPRPLSTSRLRNLVRAATQPSTTNAKTGTTMVKT